jgi:hypothetical protein
MPAGKIHRFEPMSSDQSMLRPVITVSSAPTYSVRVQARAGKARTIVASPAATARR